MGDVPSFGAWLKRRRKALDLTQDGLAQLVGCAVVTIRKLEAEVQPPSRQLAERLAEHLAIPVEQRASFIQFARQGLDAAPPELPLPEEARFPEPPSAPVRLPTGTVTFLFTDIEGSTRLWERYSSAMPTALAHHDALLRAAIASNAGILVKSTGDGVLAAFARAPDAFTAALAAQRALQAADWEAIGGLRVRMALHAGTAEWRAGDYFGSSLNRAARLLAAGHGGQILLSHAAAELVREALPPEVTLRDLGEHQLKDLSRPEHIFQLVAPDLPSAFAPLRSLSRQLTNLPAQLTALLGREREVAQVCALLRRRDVRLATLTGPGGVGKTRLALQVAAELLDDFADGVYFVDLASIRDPALLVGTIAETLGVREVAGQALIESLTIFVQKKQVLLLLDNFEQIVDAAAVLAELLKAAPALTLLVTSRITLHLSGEHEVGVPPLGLPDLRRLPPLDQLRQYAAVALFTERACAVQADFQLTDASASSVAEICHRLDGLPLAIELAAARSKLFAPDALLAQLNRRLPVLRGGPRDLPARQQTLRATIEWSYHLLEAGEQMLFARLGVFVGGCTLEAAEAVCNADGDLPLEVLDGLAALLDKSLLQQIAHTTGEPRFTMLETIREYALEQLAVSEETEALRRRHAEYFLALAEEAEPQLQGTVPHLWLRRLEAEHDNLRAALAWALAQEDAEIGVRLAVAVWWFWMYRQYISEGRGWLEAALERTRGPGHPLATLHARALRRLGMMLIKVELTRANALLEESLVLFQELGDRAGMAEALLSLGRVARAQGDYRRAQLLGEESLALFQEEEIAWGIAMTLLSLGDVALDQGNSAGAAVYFQQALAVRRAEGHALWSGWALMNLGRIAYAQGDLARAMTFFTEALGLFRELGEQDAVAQTQLEVGRVALTQGDDTRAAECFAESLRLFRETGNRRDTAYCLEGLAGVAGARRQVECAVRLFGAAEALREAIGIPLPLVLRADYEREVATARSQLNETAFVALWAEGRVLPLEQAIAEALDIHA